MKNQDIVLREKEEYYRVLEEYSKKYGQDDNWKSLNSLLLQVQNRDIEDFPDIQVKANILLDLMYTRNALITDIFGAYIHRDYIWGFGGLLAGATIVYLYSEAKSKSKKKK